MPNLAITTADVDQLGALSLDQLYSQLATAETGSSSNTEEAFGGLSSFQANLAAAASVDDIRDWLLNRGKKLFDALWTGAKTLVCKLYATRDEDGPLNEWVAVVATAIAATLGITAAAAILVIKIAIELGLDALCD